MRSYAKWLNAAIVFVLLAILSACSTVTKDGPPPFQVDVSRIPDAEPKFEKLSKSGNKPYQVFGKRYSVMKSSKNYKETGTASWYGTKFHKRNTSSGERYDMLAMTAAHKTLPLPTYVEVRNLHNNKKVIVKVNDRGPFESNRLIDLSYAAAKKLGVVGHGTAKVEITAIDPKTYYPTNRDAGFVTAEHKTPTWIETSQPQHQPTVYVQVGAFKNKLNAEKLKTQLSRFIDSPIDIKPLASSHRLYRVQIGPLKDVDLAHEINRQLKTVGLNGKVKLA